MTDEQTIEQAIVKGDWEAVAQAAGRWSQQEEAGPTPFFALNVVSLMKGEFARVWQMYAKSLQEEADREIVREWVDRLSRTHPQAGYVQLVEGVFLAQAGRSEQSIENITRRLPCYLTRPFRIFSWRRFISGWPRRIRPSKPIVEPSNWTLPTSPPD